MGRALAAVIWIMTLLSVWLFVGSGWWFPPSISEHGPAYDSQFLITIIVVGIAFVAAQIGLGIAIWRYRDKGDGTRAAYSHGNTRIEMLGVIVTAIVFISLALKGQLVWAQLHFKPAPANSTQVKVTAQQFQWNFHYAGADGKFGHTDPSKISDESLNFIGLDEQDTTSADDSVVGTLVTQVNRPAHLVLSSRDVTHSFWVPQLRFKQDAVPGLDIDVHFTPNQVGRYELACAELCGQQHYKMKSFMLVLPENEFSELMAMPQAQFQSRVTQLLNKYPISYDPH